MIEHRYIKLYGSQEEWQTALDNHELEEVAVAAITEDRTDKPDEYQYSVRETNKDNERKGEFNSSDPINYFGGLEIIWGYWGWQWSDIEYEGETLHGGQFMDVKSTTKYPDILDGYRIQHINNMTKLTPKVQEIGYFDATNVVCAREAFNIPALTRVGTGYFPNLKDGYNMFYGINKSIVGDTLYIPKIKTGPIMNNYGVLKLEEGFKIHINSEPVKIYSDNSSVYINAGVNLFDHFDGIDDLYDLSYFYTSNIHLTSEGNFVFNPKYEGDQVIILPTIYIGQNKTELTVNKPVKANSKMFASYVSGSSGGVKPVFFERVSVPDNFFSELVSPGDYDVFYGIGFTEEHPPVVFNNITYRDVYEYCSFEQPITFDCTLLKEYSEDESLSIQPFDNCSGPSLTLNNIPQGSNIAIYTNLNGFDTCVLNFNSNSTYSSFNVKAKTTVSNVTFTTKSFSCEMNLTNCTVNSQGTAAIGNMLYIEKCVVNDCIFNVNKITDARFANVYNTVCNFIDTGGKSQSSKVPIEIYDNDKEGDYSDITVNLMSATRSIDLSIENARGNQHPIVKSPVFRTYGDLGKKVNFSFNDSLEYFYAEHFNNAHIGFSILAEKNRNIKEIHFGDGIDVLNINLAQEIDTDVLMQSLNRQTRNYASGSININRIPWNKLTQVQKDRINYLFTHVTITENLENE